MTSPSPAGGSPAKKWAAVPGNGPSLETAGLIARRRKVAVLSDALQDRNGVDAYYRDLVAHLRPHLEAI